MGLYALVRERLAMDPLSGHVFVFTNRAPTGMRILFWDGSALWPATKRPEPGRFPWPAVSETEGSLRLSVEELALLVGGPETATTRRRA